MDSSPIVRDAPPRAGFAVFWAGQTAAAAGSQLREFVLPLFAVIVLHATPAELGLVAAMQWVPFLLFAIPMGVLLDRRGRKGLLIASQVGSALAVGILVLGAALGVLTLPALAVAVFVVGVFSVLFEVGYQSAVPDLAARSELTRANGRLQSTAAAADVGGPGIGGLLVQVLGAAWALLATVAASLIAAIAFARTRFAPADPAPHEGWWASTRTGVRFTLRDRYLVSNVGFSAIYNLFAQWIVVLFTVHAVRGLGLESWAIGGIFAVGAVGALVGAATTERLVPRIHAGALLVACATVETVAFLAVPLVSPDWPRAATVIVLGLAWLLIGLGTSVSNVMLITLRQLRTPTMLLGRVNASMRTVSYGVIPLGALAGGFIGEVLDVRTGLLIGALLSLVTIVWVACSPLARLRRLADADPAVEREAQPAA